MAVSIRPFSPIGLAIAIVIGWYFSLSCRDVFAASPHASALTASSLSRSSRTKTGSSGSSRRSRPRAYGIAGTRSGRSTASGRTTSNSWQTSATQRILSSV